MKLFKSIKWRLQLWYGLMLVAVLAGFELTAYQLERGRMFARLDNELHHRFTVLAEALHRPPRRGAEGPNRPPGPPPPDEFPDTVPQDLPLNRPSPEFRLRPEDAHFFGTNDPNGFYYRISAPDRPGNPEIARSDNYPPAEEAEAAEHFLAKATPPEMSQANASVPPRPLRFQNYQFIADRLRSGEFIEVGGSIAPGLKELRVTALKLTGMGVVILFFGLAGGGWLVSRALRPIEQISATAVKIAAGDLSQRISLTEAQSELGQLAAVLNSTFARLESAFAQQKQFAADAAHELRTPVSVILTQTQTTLKSERNAEAYKQTLEACQRSAQRMRRLIESLLELARFDAGQEILQRLPFDFAKTVSEGMELLGPLAAGAGVTMSAELSAMTLTGDADRLAQVVLNLLTNAIQYNQPGGEVRVTLESSGGLARLKVTDTGQGIAQENLPRVFERFYRADKSRTGGSAGLGLSISKAIVEAHGGTITVTSEEKAGTTLIVSLPL